MYVDENTIYKYIIYMTVTAQRGEIMEFLYSAEIIWLLI